MSAEEFWWSVNIPFDEEIQWNTLVTKYEDGKEQRRQKWSQPKRNFDISLRGRIDTVIAQVWSFYNARQGAYDTFYFENTNESPVTDEPVGIGDGVNVTFSLDNYPLPSGSPTAVSVAGVLQVETTDYLVAKSTGVITFQAGSIPANEEAVTATYRHCRIVRFAEDRLARELFSYKLYNSTIKLVQVL